MGKVTEKDILELIKAALNLKHDIGSDAKMGDIEEWDSLGHLAVLSALDRKFDGKVAALSDIAVADSVEKIMTVLKSNGLM